MKPGSKTETAVDGVLMAAFVAVSPWVAYAAGRWAQITLSREAQGSAAALFAVAPAMIGRQAHRGLDRRRTVP